MLNRYYTLNIWAVLTLIFFGLLAIFSFSSGFGKIGVDNDDVMRLVQVRDLLAGQNLHDHAQYRLGGEGGTIMHWSRLIDLPIAGLIIFFDLFLPRDMAESLAISVWPIMTGLGLIMGLHWLQKDYPRETLRPFIWGFGTLILLLFLITFYRFSPGRLDHHNVQLVALALAYVGLSDPAFKARRFALAGVMTGLSLAIGTEALPFLVVNCAYVAVLWAYKGAEISRSVTAFALGFTAMIIAAFLIDTAPVNYGQVQCDILAINYLALGVAGSLGLAVLSQFKALDTLIKRIAGLAALGVMCAIIILITGPECLSNPLGELPLNAQKYWLDYVEEAQPLFSKRGLEHGHFLYYAGFLSLAFFVSLWRYKSQGFKPAHFYGLAMCGAILLMVCYQLRYASFGFIIGTFMLIPWVSERFLDGKAKSKDSVAYIFALALSCVSLWQIPVVLLTPDEPEAVTNAAKIDTQNTAVTPKNTAENIDEDINICFPDSLIEYLNKQPQLTILAEPNMSAEILQFTHHRGLNGNYHRNAKGIDAAVTMFLSPPRSAAAMMKAQNIGLIIYCDDRPAYNVYVSAAKDGLAAQLKEGRLPASFTKVDAVSDDHVTVWRLP